MDTFAKTKQKLLVTGIICLAALVLSIGFHVVVSNKIEVTEQLRTDVGRAKREDLVTLKRAIRSIGEHTPILDTLLVTRDNIFAFVGDIERLGKNTGALAVAQSITVFDIGNDGKEYPAETLSEEQRSHGVLTLTMRLDGTWEQLVGFLLQLEQLPVESSLEGVRLASGYDATTKQQTWTALFELVTTIE